MNKKKIIQPRILYFLFIFILIVIFFSSFINLYEKRNKIVDWIKNKIETQQQLFTKEKERRNKLAKEKERRNKLAKDIINGGYVLLFRHAEREKWIDVTKYDAMEMLYGFKGESEYFSKAVCLSDRGLVQARAIGEVVKELKLPYHIVVSSPSCRARQTAEIVFGGYNDIKNAFLHYGPFYEDEDEFTQKVKKQILKIKSKDNSNIIISAHNGVIRSKKIFDEIENEVDFSTIAGKFMEEGGFIVMKKNNNKLIFVDLFHTFNNFQYNFRERLSDE